MSDFSDFTLQPDNEKLITKAEARRKFNVTATTLDRLIAKNNIKTTPSGHAILVNEDDVRKAWENNNRLQTKAGNSGKLIGDGTVYETGDIPIEESQSSYTKIPEVNLITAPPGSVAYYQARKIAIDGTRSLLALKQEAGELISVDKAITLYCDSLAELSQEIQEIPAKVTNLICAVIRKDVLQWKRQPDNLEAEIFRLITEKIKSTLSMVAKNIEESHDKTEEFIQANVKHPRKPRK